MTQVALSLFWPFFAGLAVLVLAHYVWVKPRPVALWERPPAALALGMGLWCAAFALEVLLWRRPWFGVANLWALVLIIAIINQLKIRALREPFVAQDFEYLVDVFRHPRLYFPFFGWWRAIAVALAFGLCVALAIHFEPSLVAMYGWPDVLSVVLPLLAAGIALLFAAKRAAWPATFDAEQDITRYGLVGACWAYAFHERADRHREPPGMLDQSPFAGSARPLRCQKELPHLVAVQSESFFDVRQWIDNVAPAVYQGFDAVRSKAYAHGQVWVPAWGANTVRTEFAFLTALRPELLGVHQFNPYRVLARHGAPTIAAYLKQLGYTTICVHPYAASFYQRDFIYPRFGFDHFIDIEAFGPQDYCGPYVGDRAVAREVMKLLKGAEEPVFVFAITMENHGPLHLEKLADSDTERLHKQPPPRNCQDLTLYLRHIVNAGEMLQQLQNGMQALERPVGMCFYGDHVPILPGPYAHYGPPSGHTDYLLWANTRLSEQSAMRALDLAKGAGPAQLHDLAPAWLKSMGIGCEGSLNESALRR